MHNENGSHLALKRYSPHVIIVKIGFNLFFTINMHNLFIMTNFIASKRNETALTAGLSLIKPDLEGYDEIYILSPLDLYPQKENSKTPGLGIDVLERGKMAEKLAQQSPEYYGAILQTLLQLRGNDLSADRSKSIGESTVSLAIQEKTGTFKVGIIFLPTFPTDWKKMGPSGILGATEADLQSDFIKHRKEISNFIMIPHEAGHLVDALKNGKLTLDTAIPLKIVLKQHDDLSTETKRENEVAGDKYMMAIFEKAKQQDMIKNPDILDRFLNYRTITSVDSALEDGSFHDHSTTLFSENSTFATAGVKHREEYATFAAKSLKSGVDLAISDAFTNAVGKNDLPDNLLWVKEASDCLQGRTEGWKASRMTPDRLKQEFAFCATNNFDTRYGVIRQITSDAPEGTGLRAIGDAYDIAVSKEFPAEKKLVTPAPPASTPQM
jgi:hypothetical protein